MTYEEVAAEFGAMDEQEQEVALHEARRIASDPKPYRDMAWVIVRALRIVLAELDRKADLDLDDDSDRDRFVAFLAGCGLPHKVLTRDDVLMLPTDDITYVTYATKVEFDMLDGYFAEDGKLAGLARPDRQSSKACGEWDPEIHEPSGLEVCRNCGSGRRSSHEAA